MSTWTTAQAWLAEKFPGYEDRPEQTGLALSIEDAFDDTAWLMAQAGCGTGKSFGALIPAITWAIKHNKTVVVSTATKALQAQYADKDLPFLAELFAANGMPFEWALIKGRGNYLCQQKLAELDSGALDVLDELLAELDANPLHTGDLDHVVAQLSGPADRMKITSTGDECLGKNECPFGETCFAEQAKKRARSAHVVIVNHAFLLVDAELRERTGFVSLLPDYDAVIIDEGHELEEYATSALGNEFTERGMMRLGSDVARWLERPDAVGRYVGLVRRLFEVTLPAILRGNGKREKKSVKITPETIVEHADVFVEMYDALRELSGEMSAVSVYGDDRKVTARKRLKKRAETAMHRILDVATAEAEDLVRWTERDDKQGVVLKYAPLHVGPFLERTIWNAPAVLEDGIVVEPAHKRAVTIMSATLTTGGNDFSFIARSIGLEADYVGFDAGTPFDFASQAALYVPKARTQSNPRGFADPSKETDTWRGQVQAVTTALVRASGGRALLLYTSRAEMLEAVEIVAPALEDAGLQVLVQDGKLSTRQLTEAFREDETSVLFALKSFMTGADFQGRTLQLLIINKLPFPVPTDVMVAARCEAADRAVAAKYGKSLESAKWHREGSFNGLTVSSMILTLLQGVGRLVRTRDDNGLMVVLDPRLLTKQYGDRILKSLPPARRIADLPTAKAYLASLDELAAAAV